MFFAISNTLALKRQKVLARVRLSGSSFLSALRFVDNITYSVTLVMLSHVLFYAHDIVKRLTCYYFLAVKNKIITEKVR